MFRATTTVAGVLTLLVLTSRDSSAQFGRGFGIGPGSTPIGDILRGEGIAAWGMGLYNLNTAQAMSINVDTTIRWNEYVYDYFNRDLMNKAEHRAARIANNKRNYDEIMKRILEFPDLADLNKGDALNALRDQLLDPRIPPSAYRFSEVTLPGETIRQIPFQYAQEKATFSMQRLLARGESEWPVSLRGVEFARARRAYEMAVDNAIELELESKMSRKALEDVEQAVRNLREKVDEVIPQTKRELYIQARNYLRGLEETARMLISPHIEKVLGAVERYPGTTVGDLLMFMQRHNLRFGVADTDIERELYKHLYASLLQQQSKLTIPQKPAKE